MPKACPLTACVCLIALAPSPSVAQDERSGDVTTTYTLDDRAGWVEREGREPDPGSDAAMIRDVRVLLADDNANAALTRLDAFIERAEDQGSDYLDEALLLRGDAKVARDEEFDALYDYERLIRSFPQSPHFVTAVDRETRIAALYLEGLKLRLFGFRLIDGEDIAIELLIRAQERLPGSAIAERAAIRVADHYYAKREMRLARDAYEVYLANYATGPNRIHAERRLIYADMARFKGPRYDGSALQDVRLRIQDFAERYPAEAAASGINEGLIARIDESTAAQLLESARWYLQREDAPATRYVLRRLIRAHPDTISAQRARELMDENGWSFIEPPPLTLDDPDAIRIEGGAADETQPVTPDADTPPDDTPSNDDAPPAQDGAP
ncbi:MAG: outer membrane protein assembly factor BamD [Planctomycetota bacterium]